MSLEYDRQPVSSVNRKRRQSLSRIVLMVLVGYCITQGATLAARLLGLTSMEYRHIFLYGGTVIFGTIAFLVIVRLKKTITARFSIFVFGCQTILFFVMYALWVYRLNEMRIFGLFCALIALTFELANTNLLQSLIMSMGTAAIQIFVTYYAIEHGHQQGSFLQELFYSLSFLPSFVFISFIAQRLQAQRKALARAKKKLELANADLVATNTELQKEKELSDQEMELAAQVQSTLLLPQLPEDSVWDVACYFKPLFGVSGDFYDFYCDDGKLAGLSLFDVSGHGVSSALVTILAKPILYRNFRRRTDEDLSIVIEQASKSIYRSMNDITMYITGIMLRFAGDHIDYVNVGHPDMLMRTAATGVVTAAGNLDERFRGRPIGIDISLWVPCVTIRVPLRRDDCILVFSDCLLESIMRNGDRHGLDRVTASLKEVTAGSAHAMLDEIMRRFFNEVNEADLRDDLTVILVRKRGDN